MNVISFNPYEVNTAIIAIQYLRRLKLREGRSLGPVTEQAFGPGALDMEPTFQLGFF